MKSYLTLWPMALSLFLLVCSGKELMAQASIEQKNNEIDLKLQLLDTRLELLDTRIRLWETKPEEMNHRLQQIDARIRGMEFDPGELNEKMRMLDSLINLQRELAIAEPVKEPVSGLPILYNNETTRQLPVCRSAIMLNPVRLFEGTFQLSFERLVTDGLSVSVSGLATYATQEGLTGYFFRNQAFSYFDSELDAYQPYRGESIAGGGIILEARDYLLADYPGHRVAPLGLYAAPQVLFRRIWISGEKDELINQEWQTRQIKRQLNVLSTGVLLGMKIPFVKVLLVDVFAGGHIRFSKYDGEAGLTRYKEWYNIDFSGVFPTAGIGIGILK